MFLLTTAVVTVKVAALAPGSTVTLDGTAALIGLLLDKPTTMPPAGADALRVTVPVVVEPPVTVDGFSVSDVRKAT
jgi:hypothetical protein